MRRAPVVLTRLAITANPWPGSVAIWQSSDGASFEVAAVAAAPCVIGETLDALPAGPTARWDRASSMRVKLYGGALASIRDARVLEGGNAAAVRNADGAWEIFQFANAVLVDGNTYSLSRLLRGQAGSEFAMAAPLPAGAPFVVLGAHMVPIAAGLDALARPMQLRIVASGRNHDDATAVALTVTPGDTALKPLAPVHVAARRAGDGIHISWIRRTRIDGDGWGIEVPLGEESRGVCAGDSFRRRGGANDRDAARRRRCMRRRMSWRISGRCRRVCMFASRSCRAPSGQDMRRK